MIAPRFRITWLMVAVGIAALDFAAIRAILGQFGQRPIDIDQQRRLLSLLLGALTTANVLAVGMLIGLLRPASRPFLVGFEAFGAMALALFIASVTCFPREVTELYINPVFTLIARAIGWRFLVFPIEWFIVAVLLVWPQVTFALAGGFLSRKFKITISPR